MSPPGGLQSLKHRVRRMHPAAPAMHRSLGRMDRASADAIRQYQERRLRLLVRLVAARSPFYRRWFAESGVDPASIRGLDDLPRLPLLTRADLMNAPEDFAVYPLTAMWPSSSSGTSGQPLTVYRTPGASAYELAALQRQWGWFGLSRKARRVVLRGSDFAADQPGAVTKTVPGNHQMLVSSFRLTSENLPAILRDLREFRPDAVEGWPSSIALLAALMRDAGEKLTVRAVITSSEMMNPGQKALMRSAFGGPIVDHYGQTERVAMAGTCEADSYHVFPDYGIVELLPVRRSPRLDRDRRYRPAQLGFPAAALSDRGRSRPDPGRALLVRPRLSAARHGGRPVGGLLRRRRRAAHPAAVNRRRRPRRAR